jgi:hypothetical protein
VSVTVAVAVTCASHSEAPMSVTTSATKINMFCVLFILFRKLAREEKTKVPDEEVFSPACIRRGERDLQMARYRYAISQMGHSRSW